MVRSTGSRSLLSIVLGVFTVGGGIFGFFGIRNVTALHKKYKKELQQLKALKSTLEAELTQVAKQVAEIQQTNEGQDRRLKVLELMEKIAELMKDRQYASALSYIDVALEIDPKNTTLLGYKAISQARTGHLRDSIKTSEIILGIDPNNVSAATNLLEFLALDRQSKEFEAAYGKYEALCEKSRNGTTLTYLFALNKIVSGDLKSAVERLKTFVSSYSAGGKKTPMVGWRFDEAQRYFVQGCSDAGKKELTEKVIAFFEGSLPANEFAQYLNTVNL